MIMVFIEPLNPLFVGVADFCYFYKKKQHGLITKRMGQSIGTGY